MGNAAEPVRLEGVPELGELQEDGLRVGIATGLGPREPRQVGPRPVQALRHGTEAAPVRLPREALLEVAHRPRQIVRVNEEPPRDRRWRLAVTRACRRVDHQPGGDGLVAMEHVVGLDAESLERRLGGDVRVAVAVPADPRAPAQERRDPWRAGARPALVGRSRPRWRLARPLPVQRRVEHAVQAGRGREERRVEEHHRRAHLVEGRRALLAEVGRPPQDRDLLAQAAPDLGIPGGRETGVVELVEKRVDAPKREKHGPPTRLGRMRRENR